MPRFARAKDENGRVDLSREFEPTGRRFDPRRGSRWAFHRETGQQIQERSVDGLSRQLTGLYPLWRLESSNGPAPDGRLRGVYGMLYGYTVRLLLYKRRESGPPAGLCKIKHDIRNRIVTPLTGSTRPVTIRRRFRGISRKRRFRGLTAQRGSTANDSVATVAIAQRASARLRQRYCSVPHISTLGSTPGSMPRAPASAR